MSVKPNDTDTLAPENDPAQVDDRQPYEAPVLIEHGRVEELTQGTFAGVGVDSGIYS